MNCVEAKQSDYAYGNILNKEFNQLTIYNEKLNYDKSFLYYRLIYASSL